MKKQMIFLFLLMLFMIFITPSFAMTTQEFDEGMAKGINYFNQGLYYEAKDEFTWFKDYNYDRMNDGQQKYLDDYLSGTWTKIEQWEDFQNHPNITRNEALQIIMRYDSRCGDPVIIDEDDNYYYIRAFMYYNKLNGYHAFVLGDYKVNKSTGEIQKIL